MTDGVTEDQLLGGRVRLTQPADGFRAGIDPVFLAAAVPAAAGEKVLEVGSGSGAASLCLAARVPGAFVTGLESDRALVRIAGGNAEANGVSGRVQFFVGDLLAPPIRLAAASFDHVMANPPHFAGHAAVASRKPGKAAANIEGEAELKDWVRFCLTMVKAKGSVVFIHRAERMDGLLAELRSRAGEITVFPLWPGANRPASRILVRARKGVSAPARLSTGLTLHEADGRYTAAAEAVLREGAAIDI